MPDTTTTPTEQERIGWMKSTWDAVVHLFTDSEDRRVVIRSLFLWMLVIGYAVPLADRAIATIPAATASRPYTGEPTLAVDWTTGDVVLPPTSPGWSLEGAEYRVLSSTSAGLAYSSWTPTFVLPTVTGHHQAHARATFLSPAGAPAVVRFYSDWFRGGL